MEKQKIEDEAKRLQVEIWSHKEVLWPGRPVHPFDALDPEVAAHVLGIKFQALPRLKFAITNARYETAGILDRPSSTILVATAFGVEVLRFTASHEVGHWQLHGDRVRLHRDMPIRGLERQVRDPIEREADYFSACFLMPAKLVRRLFAEMFLSGNQPLTFNEQTIYHLGSNDHDGLLYPDAESFDRETILANARSFAGRRFEKSLAEMFQVSVATMAIRIRELELVRRWP